MDSERMVSERVELIPLQLSHAEALFECSRDEEIWAHFVVEVTTLHDMEQFIAQALYRKASGEQVPFVVYDKLLDKIVGMTRLQRIDEVNKTISIGWTWYARSSWRTYVNTECKYLLLTYAFEQWHAVRVELITITDHFQSQRAIERLGAKKEGIMRKRFFNRDYVVYSIIDTEWAATKHHIERLRERY